MEAMSNPSTYQTTQRSRKECLNRIPRVNLEGMHTDSDHTPTDPAPIIRTESESVDDAMAELSEEEELALLTAELEAEDRPVSPFGFGPYPEVPSDYPEKVAWEQDIPEGMGKIAELFDRVLIKLWNQGHKVTSISGDSYRMYPALPNTIFVTWEYETDDEGNTTRHVTTLSSGTGISEETIDSIVDTGVVPPGITVLDYESDYIDPYDFLTLQR